ncbi:hypothetical protein NIES37_64080 [Tolypothrix tenuis PCC 7101]|uniref:Uncharacterized protein n=1 Tax=Tolypothrix tenuis PCC 7101 TaxID=231146 RepID=A0A1Z4N9M6_9CYAN|nr:hypothetical protein NIES37_64080 [Tolypothrix tenuis PCC 7101]BAZ73683.1 hypothetical protein NIES50_22490 [Aulosira laxa NIES-50]
MSIVISLSPEIEAQLREKAAQQGQDVSLVAAELLTRMLEWELQDLQEATVGIQRGLDDFEAGFSRLFQVNVDELIKFAKTLEGQELETAKFKCKFVVNVVDTDLYYTPLSSGILRKHSRKWLERVCQRFSITNSFKPGDYTDLSKNASYALVVISRYLENSKEVKILSD